MFHRHTMYAVAMLAAIPVVWLLGALTPLLFALHWPGARIAILMIVVSPLLEEIVFRAGVQDGLAGWLGGRSVAGLTAANLLTAIIFALAHLWHHPPVWALSTVVPALVFGIFYERHDHLAAPIGLHAAYNAAYLLLLRPV